MKSSPKNLPGFIHAIIVLSCMNSLISKLHADNTTDHLALLSFRTLVSDPSGALTSWNNTIPLCQWQGVSCSSRRHPERVTALQLDSLNLTGSLSPHIANLTFLKKLHLSTNRLHGPIPQELSRLSRLQYLNLSFNFFDGGIPINLSYCADLRNINLSNNMLEGAIPMDLGSLAELLSLNLGGNSLSGGIPPSLGNISSLTSILLYDNGLEGSIPDSLGRLERLQIFQVSINKISGEIPSSLYNLSNIQYFVAGENQLVGTLPPNLFYSLPNLHMLLLNDNAFHGAIPSSLPNATELVELDLKGNKFSGTVPSDLGRLQNLYWINLGNNSIEARDARDWSFLTSLTNCSLLGTLELAINRLGGELPNSMGNLSAKLDWLSMGQNRISGKIPEGIGNLVNLTVLSLNKNLLTGTIPASIGRLRKLHVVNLSRNKFSGQFPSSFGNLTQLNRLFLEESGLSGSIPPNFGNCKNLEVLDLSYNKLSGDIPKELLSISSLSRYLYLQGNAFEGSLPSEVGQLKNLNELDFSGNNLSGKIPDSIGECQSLEYLNMGGNFFQGAIPESLGNLKGLLALDLSSNNLSERIPESLANLDALLYLNLSFNNLEGSVPNKGVFKNTSAVSVLGNIKLCGDVTGLQLPKCNGQSSQSSRKNHLSLALLIIIPIISVLFCIGILLLVFVILRRRNSRNPSPAHAIENHFMRITYTELVKATNGFSSENLIGTGSFGSVYRGILGSDGNCVAVKVLNLEQTGAAKSFLAECEVLRYIRHRNLVRIVTTCSTSDSSGNDFKAIVLEYMPNGSLEQWLYNKICEESEVRTLSLTQRLNISIDVAYALDYLHNHGNIPIVHCDLKPSNVLLDEDMHAHVSDFGLAKFLSSEKPSSYESTTSSIGIKGSIGYIAPEYGMGSKVSTDGDVYSYGILLLELFTGKRPTNEIFKEGFGLRRFVEMAFPDLILDAVDSSLLNKDHGPEAEGNYLNKSEVMGEEQECLASVLRIGLSCSNEDPRERMKMGSVVTEMLAIKNRLVKFVTYSD